MNEAIQAYRGIAIDEEFKSLEWIRRKARHDEAQALGNAERMRDEHWRRVVAEKDTAIAEQAALIAKLQAMIGKQ